jgi:hypothetical protein
VTFCSLGLGIELSDVASKKKRTEAATSTAQQLISTDYPSSLSNAAGFQTQDHPFLFARTTGGPEKF